MENILVIIFSYLSGSIPFGLILTKIFISKDIRKFGSGNIGTTNVLRVGNKLLAVFTLILDSLKGYIPVFITINYYPELFPLSALTTFLGHLFPIWLKFKGGKGVATYLGILFGLSIPLALLFIFTWAAVLLIFKYASVASLFATLTVFIISSIREIIIPVLKNLSDKEIILNNHLFILFIFLILIIYTHRKNISNLKNKTETKIKI